MGYDRSRRSGYPASAGYDHLPMRQVLILLAMSHPGFACVRRAVQQAAARARIAETLPQASEQRPVNITFRTHADGVKLSLGLKSKYPDDMTIILQHDFEQLNIKEDRFEVLLRLHGRAGNAFQCPSLPSRLSGTNPS